VPPEQPPGRPHPWVEGQTAAYHITHVENLASIVECGHIDCDSGCTSAARSPIGIAHSNLKEKRARRTVQVAAGGTLADYVPFYFAPRSPMLCAIWYGNVPEYVGSQEDIVHLVCSIQELARPGRFVITSGHPIMAVAEQYDDLDALDEVDWSVMGLKVWKDTDEDGSRKFRRQAEFLVHRRVPVEAIRLVGAMSAETAERATASLAAMRDPPPVTVRKGWYY
jgi:hypothetical protein